ncbi:MAG: OmpA family protein [Flavobacteriales bacterium]
MRKLLFIFSFLVGWSTLSAQGPVIDYSGRCFCESCTKASQRRDSVAAITKKTPVDKTVTTVVEPTVKKSKFNLTESGASIDTGMVYVFRNVRFVHEQAVFMDKSFPELDQLVAFLKKNPTVKISIQGHVNGPGQPNNDYYQNLSEARCQAVQMYLMEHGIKSNRLSKKGFGNSKMLFPAPTNESEAEANRRVEIVITAK